MGIPMPLTSLPTGKVGQPLKLVKVEERARADCNAVLTEWTYRMSTLMAILAIPEVETVREHPVCVTRCTARGRRCGCVPPRPHSPSQSAPSELFCSVNNVPRYEHRTRQSPRHMLLILAGHWRGLRNRRQADLTSSIRSPRTTISR